MYSCLAVFLAFVFVPKTGLVLYSLTLPFGMGAVEFGSLILPQLLAMISGLLGTGFQISFDIHHLLIRDDSISHLKWDVV